MLIDFFKHKTECSHEHLRSDLDESYCPDCGALVRNKWYLVRCSCCNIKRKAFAGYEIKPDAKYCPNCGSSDFYIQELDKINFTDINYAVLKRIVVQQSNCHTNQVWVEKEDNLISANKLLELRK